METGMLPQTREMSGWMDGPSPPTSPLGTSMKQVLPEASSSAG